MRLLHLIATALACAVIATTTPAAPSAAPDHEPSYYICTVARTGPFGHIYYSMNVPIDGSAPFLTVNWENPRRAEGLRLSVQWYGPPLVDGRFDDSAGFSVQFVTSRPTTRDMRIEIRRARGDRDVPELAYAGPYRRPHPMVNTRFHVIEMQERWEELDAWMRGRDFLTFALVRRNGAVVAEDRLDAATVAAAADAIADVRREAETMASDYRRRCEVPDSGPVVAD